MSSGLGDGVRDSGSHAYQIGRAALGGSATIVVRDRRGATTLEALAGTAPASVVELIEQWGQWEGTIESLLEKSGSRGLDFSKLEWLSPVMPRKLICIGANYSDHNREMPGAVSTPVPYSFMKPPTTALIGSGRTIRLPEHAAKIDYEAELAVVIGRHAHRVPSESALSFVFGYSVLNDVSARDWMPAESPLGPDWTMLKGFDESAPMGPWITPAKFVPDPQNLDISLSVNGRVKQDSNTSQMIFTVAQVIQHLASLMTLEPGDVIATGTPSGVGFGRKPQEFLKPGDHIRVEIEGLGVLENSIAAIERDPSPSRAATRAAHA
ncbi:MAG TPA: fumarylacetoacetate hydrolase family protein [Gaiellaceae bacterium]|nr:fumarylacetoacetate hydrolase family protein [Gaiellaceae bacterium]